jgi:hypothetical protein
MAIFYGWNDVLRHKDMHILELFNEFSISVINLHLISFSYLHAETSTRTQVGWSAIAYITLVIIINLGYVFWLFYSDAYRKLRTMYYLWLRAKILHKLRSDAAARAAAKKIITPPLSPRFFSDFYVLKDIKPEEVKDD